MVKYPFEVYIRRLTSKEIKKYTVRSGQTNCSCTARPSVVTIRSSPATTRSMTKRKINKGLKWRTISGHLSQLPTQQRHTFKVRMHILHKHKHKTYMKCRVKGFALACITFNTIKDLNTHYQIYHGNIVYKCHKCKKIINTLSTWRFHKYCQKPKVYKCDNCNKQFMFRSKLKQHRHKHISQKLFKCFYGGCNRSYKHPQDLERHTFTHQQIKFECEMCDKTFSQKHLILILMLCCIIALSAMQGLSTIINCIGIRRNAIINSNQTLHNIRFIPISFNGTTCFLDNGTVLTGTTKRIGLIYWHIIQRRGIIHQFNGTMPSKVWNPFLLI